MDLVSFQKQSTKTTSGAGSVSKNCQLAIGTADDRVRD
jgi:hypothetical protein